MMLARVPSLQTRLLALLVAVVTVVWLGAAFATWLYASHELDELLDSHLAQAGALLVVQQTHIDVDDDNDVIDVPTLHKYAPTVAFQVFHLGTLVMGSTNVGAQPLSDQPRGFKTVRLPDGFDWRVFAARGDHSDVQVYVAERTSAREAIVMKVLIGLLLPLVVALPLLAVLMWSSVRVALAPLRKLTVLVGGRKPQALSPIPSQGMPPEMQPLLQELNGLLARIEHMVDTERRFTADAAHELRHPIAAIRAQAQVALGAGSNSAERDLALHATLAGCDRATRMVEQLLALARLEATDAPPASTTTPEPQSDLAVVAQAIAADLAPAALARNQVLELEASPACRVAANGVLLGMLLRNVLDNALRYAPDGARILVTVHRTPSTVVLDIQDSGPGMQEADIQRLGERFFRVLGNALPGSGLGWSIVRRIALVTQGSVVVQRSGALGGLQVTVAWPA